MYKQIIFPVLSRFDTETTHDRTTQLTRVFARTPFLPWLIGKLLIPTDPRLKVSLPCGLSFRNPLGVAAGLDKHALSIEAFDSLGFSHDEIGTVPPLAQPGNDQPRLFRLLEDRALINRMGFNSPGAPAVRRNLERSKPRRDFKVGISVGANKKSVEAGRSVEDYIDSAKILAPFADYFAINVSSPNTPGLRDLQYKESLEELISRFRAFINELFPELPVFVKFSPDLTWGQLDDALEVVEGRVEAIIDTNTTLDRKGLVSQRRGEPGGMSGPPLLARSREVVEYTYRHTQGRVPIIGVGGITTWRDAVIMARSGATALQMLTAVPYEGPLVANRLNRGLSAYLDREGVESFQDLVGLDAA